MQLEKYYSLDNSKLSFTQQQASEFAKSVAGDFNALHDVGSKRFCVPGDLLFSVIIKHYGLRQVMGFSFSGMVNDDVTLILPTNGGITQDQSLIDTLIKDYVEFSGHTFPHVLVPLLKDHNVMINTERPLVIYDHMRISLDTLDIDSLDLSYTKPQFRLYGKRGDVALNFDFHCNGEYVGKGQKKMVLSGLREYDQDKIDKLVADFNEKKNNYVST
jgi:hypothetical protein